MNQILEQLKDIDGLDRVSFWPFTTSLWALIAFALVLLVSLIVFIVTWVAFKRSWKSDTLKKLKLLEKNLDEQTAKKSIILLSEYLKRIAIKRFSRQECAALVGDEWLLWLSNRDPKKFDWQQHGRLLIDAPYAPATEKVCPEKTRLLIYAVKNWVQ